MSEQLRNVAIIAHVDHGKTTLVDQMLKQSGMFREGELDKLAGGQHGLIMDSNPIERERGITILSKNCSIAYTTPEGEHIRINIVDTPGHADFGGEVERVLRMADGCLLLVDAAEGPMPQTRFVLSKAIEAGLRPVVVINKCDRPDGRPQEVINEVFDLLVELGAEEDALDFPIVYAAGRDGWASRDIKVKTENLRDLFETIIERVPAAKGDRNAPLQMLVTMLDYSEYVGRIGIGRVFNGVLKRGQPIAVLDRGGERRNARVTKLMAFSGLARVEVEEVAAGDLCAVVGIEKIDIGDTLADFEKPVPLPPVKVDEPTLTMVFRVNDSPFAGQEGEYVTSRQIRERLLKECEHNVALRVEFGAGDEFVVSGRGLLHLGILIENMRREGFELAVGKPRVITKEIHGKLHEPIEILVVECPNESMGAVMELVGQRGGIVETMEPRGDTRTYIEFEIASRGLIGLRSRVMTATAGEGIMHHAFERYAPVVGELPGRGQGVLLSLETGSVTAYALEALSDRGVMFVVPQDKVYMGQIVGEHNRENDLTVNITRLKQLTNFREATKEAFVRLKAARKLSLEACLEYIEEDELVEITPTSVRMRKRLLNESERKKADRADRDRNKTAAEV
ncbi:MAG TPA: translational GTPase TypA [Phycisphaerales bacterium]|nr:translational GTPase TypA [Phycisphaerales bacterium]